SFQIFPEAGRGERIVAFGVGPTGAVEEKLGLLVGSHLSAGRGGQGQQNGQAEEGSPKTQHNGILRRWDSCGMSLVRRRPGQLLRPIALVDVRPPRFISSSR